MLQRDRLDDIGQRAIACPDAAFSRAATAAASVVREVQEVGLDAARLRVRAGVRVNREEEVRAFAVRDRRPLLQRDELVGPPREDHFDAGCFCSSSAAGAIEDELGFGDALPGGAGSWPP